MRYLRPAPRHPMRGPMRRFGSRFGRAFSRRAGLLLAGLFAIGCQPGADEEAATTGAAELPERPATMVDTLAVEGMPEPITLRLFTWEDSAGLPLSFYVPEGLTPERFAADGGAAVRVAANFTGVADSAAFLHIYAHPPGTTEEEARTMVRGILTGLQVPVSQGSQEEDVADAGTSRTDRFSWALLERAFQMPPTGQPRFVGALGLGRHGDRFFHVLYRYPPEYGDGMGPRMATILATWRWEDTGEMLEGG
ncbi:MAG: hypothetical protein WEB88_08455 [Gemmatimonadota bacterium]